MIVDVHTHLWEKPEQLGPAAADRLRRIVVEPWDRPEATAAALDQAMEVVQAAIIQGFVSRFLGACITARNVASYVARNPQKYVGFAGIDPMDDAWPEQLREARDLGLTGLSISPSGQDFHPMHSAALKLYELCERDGLPVVIHPGHTLAAQARLEYGHAYLFDEVARTFPGLKLIFAQVGHPFVDQALVLLGKHRNVFADLSDVADRPWQLYGILEAAHQQGVTDRLLLGSNFPFSTPEKVITTMYSINGFAHGTHLPVVPREKIRQIVERDAFACLGIPSPVPSETAERSGQASTPSSPKGGIV